MADDLVERLREPDCHDPKCPFKLHCYCDEGAPHDTVRHPHALEAADAIESLRAENARLTKQVANLEARGIHSCNDECQRPLCVAQRENARLREALEAAGQALWNALDHLGVDDPDADATIQQIDAALAHKDVNA